MRDLELWRRLQAGAVTPADLDAIAGLTLVRRGPFLDGLAALTGHAEPAVRAAAVWALAGARGVPAVRAIVAGLDDPEPAVRAAALDALRATAQDAPDRFAHALFHPRVEVRRAALALDLPRSVAQLAAYLRGDPACAELAAQRPWPDGALPLAFDLHAAGRLDAEALIALVVRTPVAELRAFVLREHGRTSDAVDAYLEDVVRAPRPTVAPGVDVLDALVAAIAATGHERALDHVVETVTPRRDRKLTRRAAAAMLSHLATRAATPSLIGACVALEPRLLGSHGFDPRHAAVAAAGLVRFRWPVKPTVAQVEKLIRLPIVRGPDGGAVDLALAAALAGLLPGRRLTRLGELLGEPLIVAALVAGDDHGWDQLCRLPVEKPALELAWLGRVERASLDRHAALAGRALAVFTGPRLEGLVDQLPRRHRPAAVLAFAARADLDAGDAQLAAVAKAIAARLERGQVEAILAGLLADAAGARARALAVELARALPDKLLTAGVAAQADPAIARLLAACERAGGLLYSREQLLGQALAACAEPTVQAWTARVAAAGAPRPPAPASTPRGKRALTDPQREQIATCAEAALARALAPALAAPSAGLCDALARRRAAPSVSACAALLGCVDPIEEVARELDRFAGPGPRFGEELDNEACGWQAHAELPPLAHARLWRWEVHTFALAAWMDGGGGLHAALRLAEVLPGRLAAQTLWRALSDLAMFLRYRDRPRLVREGSLELAGFVIEHLDRDVGRDAARLLAALVEARALDAAAIRDRVFDRAIDADAETRGYLSRLVQLDGLPAAPERAAAPAADLIATIRASDDLDALIGWCEDTRRPIVEEAALRLVILGAAGQRRLAELLGRLRELPVPLPIAASVTLWDDPAALAVARAFATTADLPPPLRFHLGLGLCAGGDRALLSGVLAAAREPADRGWFQREDWDALVRLVGLAPCALALADSPHAHAYHPAVLALADGALDDADGVDGALRRFLEVDGDRPLRLRRAAAVRLAVRWGDLAGMPIVIGEVGEDGGDWEALIAALPVAALPVVVHGLASAALLGGPSVVAEKRLVAVTQKAHLRRWLDAGEVAGVFRRILEEATGGAERRAAAEYATDGALADHRLRRVAEVFAWGVRRGVELTGKLFRVHMTGREQDLGHTFLDGSKVFVSPLPLLRDELHGQDVVEGLILHELGHHVYHRGEVAAALWKRAQGEGLHPLLNLVADEHLERNLRAVDRGYGDRLKRLGAYAFMHAPQEIAVARLVACLRGATAHALIGAELEVGFDEASVRLRRGAALTALDRAGHPLARFVRALRLGLGNRSGDPRVEQALALCGDIRKLDMPGLYALTRALADLFGGAASVATLFGGAEDLIFGERDGDVFGAGVEDGAVQREVERILDPRRGKRAPPGTPSRLQINVNPDEHFPKITRVDRLRGDPAAHRAQALEVNRHAVRLRAFLDDLGLRWEPARARLQGRAIDRARLRPLVTRGDPRLLVARQPVRRTDLFLGTIIDCSSSMTVGDNIERARRFGVLIAEAVRPLAGVEARFFGFTESVIYDAGDAGDCAVTSLRAGGGNNDAAALLHAAQVAAASPRAARVLVMISDGLPTECSVASLRALVTHLTRRRGMVCAQVAVRPLEEACFPNYVVLDDASVDVSVARFGRMIGALARKVLAS